MRKKDSAAWQLALKRAKRKNVFAVPIELLDDGRVRMQSIIRDYSWVCTYEDLLALEHARKIKIFES